MARLRSAGSSLPAGHRPAPDALGAAEQRLGRAFPKSFRDLYAAHGHTVLAGGYRMLAAERLRILDSEGYERSHPESWGAVVFAENGHGDALALFLLKRSDHRLGARIYELRHESGMIRRRSPTRLVRG